MMVPLQDQPPLGVGESADSTLRGITAPTSVELESRQRVWRWFTEGNVPVKIGMLVLFAGVAALLKYASDSGMLHVPAGLRVALIAFAAIAGLPVALLQSVWPRRVTSVRLPFNSRVAGTRSVNWRAASSPRPTLATSGFV